MRLIRRTALWAVVVLCLHLTAIGQDLPTASPSEIGLSSRNLDRITPAMRKLVEDKSVAGIVTMVAWRGKVVQFNAYGMRDIEAEKPMERDTIFRIYSMTKPITSVAAMMLYEEGKFKLDDLVSKYIPDFKGLTVVADPTSSEITQVAQKREMTIRDLLRHTSGLTYGVFGDTAVDKLYRKARTIGEDGTLKGMVKRLGGIPLLYQPGTKWHYSVSTDVLGYLVEVLSGRPLDDFFAERIFDPLGMKDTGFYVPAEKLSRFATNYGPKSQGGLRVVDAPATSRYRKKPTFLSGGGGLVSTASDYMRFCLMLLNKGEFGGKRLLKAETVELMTKNHLPKGVMHSNGVGFGLGFSVRVQKSEEEPAPGVGEYGWGGAASTHFWISPRDEIAVVALTQYMPYSNRVERILKPLVYEAILDGK